MKLYTIIIGIVLVLAGCDSRKPVRQITNLGDTPYQQDSILVTYATDPERALTLLDSALLLGNISEYRGQFIRAKIYCKSRMFSCSVGSLRTESWESNASQMMMAESSRSSSSDLQ